MKTQNLINRWTVLGTAAVLGASTLGVLGTPVANARDDGGHNATWSQQDNHQVRGNQNNWNNRQQEQSRPERQFRQPDRNDHQFQGDRNDNHNFDNRGYDNRNDHNRGYDNRYDNNRDNSGNTLTAGILGLVLGAVLSR